MNKIFLLEIISHETGQVIGRMKGTAYSLAQQLQTVLEELPEGHGVTITESYV